MDSPIARTSIDIATCACTSAAAPARRLTRKPSASRYPWCALLRRDGKSSCPRAPRWAITCLGVLPPSSRDLTASRRRSGRKPASGLLDSSRSGPAARKAPQSAFRPTWISRSWTMFIFRCSAARALAAALLMCPVFAAFAQVADQPGAGLPTIVVTAQHLNEERSRIDTQTGASTYTFNASDIQSAPGGDNVQLNQVMLQVPDAAQDSFGQLHIRGDHNGLQFRLNGVILPDGISVFGQTLPPRMIASMKLITGSLPAEYGLRSAGIIDLTTKGGALQPGGDVSLYGGSHASIEPSFNYGGTSGSNTYFVTGDLIRNDLGIESPDGRTTPLHDHTKQYHGFGYFEHLFDETNRLSVVAGSSDDRFEIPNLAGVHAADIGAGLTVNGQTDFLSNNLNENQREVTQFAAVSLQHSAGPLSVQTSLITRYSSLNFTPDPLGDLLFNGIAERAYKRDVAYALQSDGAYQLNESHTLRVGVYAQTDRLTSNTSSRVLQTSGGVPINDVPVAVIDETRNSQYIESAYLQDEWHINSRAVVHHQHRVDVPLILQIGAFDVLRIAGLVDDRDGYIIDRYAAAGLKHQRAGVAGETVGLCIHPDTQRVGLVQLVRAVALQGIGDVALVGLLRDAVEEQIPERIRCEIQARVAGDERGLHAQGSGRVLQAHRRKLRDFTLIFVEVVAEEVRLPVHGEARTDVGGVHAGEIRNLEAVIGGSGYHR